MRRQQKLARGVVEVIRDLWLGTVNTLIDFQSQGVRTLELFSMPSKTPGAKE